MLLPPLPLCCEKDSKLLGASTLTTTDTSGKSSSISKEELATTNLMEEEPFLNSEKTKRFYGFSSRSMIHCNQTCFKWNYWTSKQFDAKWHTKVSIHRSNSANISAVDKDFYGRYTLVFQVLNEPTNGRISSSLENVALYKILVLSDEIYIQFGCSINKFLHISVLMFVAVAVSPINHTSFRVSEGESPIRRYASL